MKYIVCIKFKRGFDPDFVLAAFGVLYMMSHENFPVDVVACPCGGCYGVCAAHAPFCAGKLQCAFLRRGASQGMQGTPLT